MSKAQPVDWYAIPEIQAVLQHLQDHRDGKIESPANIGDWFREPDKEYLLRVKVSDVDLAQAVITRAFSDHSLIPGLEVTEVILRPEDNLNTQIANRLRQLADEVEHGGGHG